jgi:dinuclear metal center YbgI/SA1388 family protein
MTRPLVFHDDRLFPADGRTREIARALYGQVKGLPIISPHGHTDPAWFATNAPFEDATDLLLAPDRFKDYGPNGLQVEGRTTVRKIVSGVTASRALIEAAIHAEADAIFVHHGLFWRGQDGRVTGWMRQRLGLLLGDDVNLFAYHLPLDAHPELGNNAQLGLQLGLVARPGSAGRFGEQELGFVGGRADGESFASAKTLAAHAEEVLNRPVALVDTAHRAIKTIAWCTGGAQGYFEDAIAAGADAFITGEISEPQAHYAREMGVAYLACGHHATERYGAPAVAAHVAAQLGLAHEFIDIDNPA